MWGVPLIAEVGGRFADVSFDGEEDDDEEKEGAEGEEKADGVGPLVSAVGRLFEGRVVTQRAAVPRRAAGETQHGPVYDSWRNAARAGLRQLAKHSTGRFTTAGATQHGPVYDSWRKAARAGLRQLA